MGQRRSGPHAVPAQVRQQLLAGEPTTSPCTAAEVSSAEQAVIQSRVFNLSREGTANLRSTSFFEAQHGLFLNGSYCSWYSRQVACQQLGKLNDLPGEDKGCRA